MIAKTESGLLYFAPEPKPEPVKPKEKRRIAKYVSVGFSDPDTEGVTKTGREWFEFARRISGWKHLTLDWLDDVMTDDEFCDRIDGLELEMKC